MKEALLLPVSRRLLLGTRPVGLKVREAGFSWITLKEPFWWVQELGRGGSHELMRAPRAVLVATTVTGTVADRRSGRGGA